jgi:RND family efflux transporter MFP subunit
MTEERPEASPDQAVRIRRAKGRRRLFVNLGLLVVVLAVGAYFWQARRSRPQLPEGLITGKVEQRDVTQTVSATGSVTAQTGAMVKIGSQITGRIKRLHADVGDKIGAGDVIAELDVPDLRAQVQQAEASLASSRARLQQQVGGVGLQDTQAETTIRQAQASLGTAQSSLKQVEQAQNIRVAAAEATVRQAQANAANSAANLSRQEQLFQQGYVAAAGVDAARAQAGVDAAQLSSAQENLRLVRTQIDADVQSARNQVRQAEATLAAAQAGSSLSATKRQQVAEARAAVRQAEASLAYSRAQLDKADIRSPISGTVLQLTQQQGETIAAGLSAPTLIIVADLDRLQVDAYVDETDIGRVKIGQRAEVTVDAYPSRPFPGRVVKIASGATMQENVVTYGVTIALDSPSRLLKPDMTATVNVIVARHENVLTVPVDAIKLSTKGATVTVVSIGRDGQAAYRTGVSVRTGISDGEHTEIVSGLRAGEEVVLAGEVPGSASQTGGPGFRGPLGLGGGGGRR